ncbi:MAG: hypothetical protein D3903_02320 [Candidatus Electrothrix sp. GM3_4]|nr:hypothetical protein [Candidatus Electrothrix sp. GM3_4]
MACVLVDKTVLEYFFAGCSAGGKHRDAHEAARYFDRVAKQPGADCCHVSENETDREVML